MMQLLVKKQSKMYNVGFERIEEELRKRWGNTKRMVFHEVDLGLWKEIYTGAEIVIVTEENGDWNVIITDEIDRIRRAKSKKELLQAHSDMFDEISMLYWDEGLEKIEEELRKRWENAKRMEAER